MQRGLPNSFGCILKQRRHVDSPNQQIGLALQSTNLLVASSNSCALLIQTSTRKVTHTEEGEAYKRVFMLALQGISFAAQLARVILASQLHFLFDFDPAGRRKMYFRLWTLD